MEYKINKQSIGEVIWLKISYGEDLAEKISAFCSDQGIKSAYVSAIGALKRASIGYYDQKERKYVGKMIEKPLEIASFTGNVSLKDGKPFLHAHICLADEEGAVLGGHLNEGNIAFACECAIFCLKGKSLERKYDETTGLSLWDFS
jgi:hypothetical protein